jgi:hypothetical protein
MTVRIVFMGMSGIAVRADLPIGHGGYVSPSSNKVEKWRRIAEPNR